MKNAGRTVGKRVIALLSVLCILCSLIVVPASAAETSTYLYNGVELPALPEWDREKYPYALIRMSSWFETFNFRAYSDPLIRERDTSFSVTDGEAMQVWSFLENGEWGDITIDDSPVSGLSEMGSPLNVLWSNYDILNADGTLYLAASDPVPVQPKPITYSVKIYDDVGILDDVDVPEGSYLYIGSYGYDIVGPDDVVIGGSSLDPALSGSMFCGLTANSSAEVATYGPGTTLNITQDSVYYVVLKDTYKVNLYSQYGNLIDIIDCTEGQTAVTINLGSLDFDLWNGPDFRYGFNLGAGEMILGLSSSPSSQYAYQWGVGETVYIDGPMYLYVIKSYPYPVVLNFNNGVDINTFTGFQKSTIRVNESSIDFIDYVGNVQSYSIPLNGSDDAFWGLATSPYQSTPEYVPGDVIYAYDTTELYLVRKSDYYSAISGGGGSGDSGGTGDSGSTPDQVVGDVPDVGDFVSDQAISSMSDIFASVFNSPLILSIFMISVVLMFVSYVLFGKKT